MSGVLLTGFEPFGGAGVNASWEAVQLLEGERIAGVPLSVVKLPCVFRTVLEALWQEVTARRPELLILVGEAGGRREICLERVAINLIDAPIPDNEGAQPIDGSVVEEGPMAYFTDLPVKAMLARLLASGIPASLSQSAGSFVCNQVFYGARHFAQTRGPRIRLGLVHVPILPQAVPSGSDAPSMGAEIAAQGLRLIVEEALAMPLQS